MRKLLYSILLLIIAISINSCHTSDSNNDWYNLNLDSIDNNKVDFIYLVSAQFISLNDKNGEEIFKATLTDSQKTVMNSELEFIKHAYADSMNFFAPYYHQFTVNATINDNYPVIKQEVADEIYSKFKFYMENYNGGRPYILAGFSEGAIFTIELLKRLSSEEYSKLISAYAIGYKICDDDLKYEYIQPATDATGIGNVISFNSVMNKDAAWSFLSEGAVTCINPVNWVTDTTPARFVYQDDTAYVHVDSTSKILIVEGLNPEKYIFAPMSDFCKTGNLHHWDILFYKDYIRRNALDRSYIYKID